MDLITIILILCITTLEVRNQSSESYLVNLTNCRIPETPLFPEEILPFHNAPYKTNCSEVRRIAIVNDQHILKLSTYARKNFIDCCYREIRRPKILEKDTYILSRCYPIQNVNKVSIPTMEYFQMYCTKKSDGSPALEYNYQILDKDPQVQKKLQYWNTYDKTSQSSSVEPFNIMFLLVDSVSRAHALRSFPKTVKHLKEDLNFIDFKGYHCVGEPTVINYIPMTLGLSFAELQEKRGGGWMRGKFDNEPFIHKNFSDTNYLTMHIEDLPDWHTFNFDGREGFITKQTDFYTRPFILFWDRTKKEANCLNGQPIYDFMLDYTLGFYKKFINVPKYTTTFSAAPQHDDLKSTKVLDDSLLNFFKGLEKSKVLDNTIIFFLADHGYRKAEGFSETKYGLLERNLPLFMTRFPERFVTQFPDFLDNLQENSERLTSHFDLFQTVVHLHKLIRPGGVNASGNSYGYNNKGKGHGRSLFEKIPLDRDCKDAGIHETYCSCNFPLFDKNFDSSNHRKMVVV